MRHSATFKGRYKSSHRSAATVKNVSSTRFTSETSRIWLKSLRFPSLVRTGFPPKLIDTSISQGAPLSILGIRSGDTIIVAESSAPATSNSSKPSPLPLATPPTVASSSSSSAPVATRPRPAQVPTATKASSNSPQFVEVDGGFLVLRVSCPFISSFVVIAHFRMNTIL